MEGFPKGHAIATYNIPHTTSTTDPFIYNYIFCYKNIINGFCDHSNVIETITKIHIHAEKNFVKTQLELYVLTQILIVSLHYP